MLSLYPPLEAYDTGMLKVDDIHTLYYEQSGNPQGAPVVFLHGGPGGGTSPKHRQFFDPQHYRIIIFDQRGAGKSTPLGELRQNTTAHLVDDLEKLRQHLKINRWHILGGSWGSTLALTYAIQHTDKVSGMILRGIYLMRQSDIDWFLHGIKSFFPEAWHWFAEHIPPEERGDILNAYYKRIMNPDRAIYMPAAHKWMNYTSDCLRVFPTTGEPQADDDESYTYAKARIECHYCVNNKFEPDNYLLTQVDKIRHIPSVIIHGRYDMICPPEGAYELHKSWPEAQFIMVAAAGHASSEPGTTHELITATNTFRTIKV